MMWREIPRIGSNTASEVKKRDWRSMTTQHRLQNLLGFAICVG
jgi:hypothetical protein